MREDLAQLVRIRAKFQCEYCRMPEIVAMTDFEIDHIIARSHGGETNAGNLALACFHCNSFKGPNLAGIDPHSRRIVRLFHPRKDRWKAHFTWSGPLLIGQSRIARSTLAVLRINNLDSLIVRQELIEEGYFP